MVGIFVEGPPTVKIIDGLVHISPRDRNEEYICLPSTFRAFVTRGEALLAKWEVQQSGAVPLRGKAP